MAEVTYKTCDHCDEIVNPGDMIIQVGDTTSLENIVIGAKPMMFHHACWYQMSAARLMDLISKHKFTVVPKRLS